ncbi:hypothetical protein [Inquilinus sp. CAU 1745]|uniref:hypothetical protein n=1 Tax=Inquilinus sp. CAU 1745 TaxID=3140369 RepID=UPI00325BC733
MTQSINAGSTEHKLTWLATIICIILVLPGLAIGSLFVAVYRFLLYGYVSASWIPHLEEVAMQWFPNLLHGAVGGWIAIAITAKLFKQSNLEIVAYASAAAWIATMLAISGMGFALGAAFDLTFIALIAQLLGIALGLYTGRESVAQR